MLGRALFALVCLIIAAGALLPMYSPAVEAPGPVSADPAILIADLVVSDCRDCASADGKAIRCHLACGCERTLPTSSGSPETSLNLTVYLIVGRSSEPWWLASKIPAI